MHCNCNRPSLSLPDKEWRKERLNCFDIAHSIFSVHIKIMFGEYKYDRPNNINNSPYSFLMDRRTGPQNAKVEIEAKKQLNGEFSNCCYFCPSSSGGGRTTSKLLGCWCCVSIQWITDASN